MLLRGWFNTGFCGLFYLGFLALTGKVRIVKVARLQPSAPTQLWAHIHLYAGNNPVARPRHYNLFRHHRSLLLATH